MSNDFFFSFPFIKVRIFVLLLCLPFLSLNQELVLFLKFSLGRWTSVKRERERERESLCGCWKSCRWICVTILYLLAFSLFDHYQCVRFFDIFSWKFEVCSSWKGMKRTDTVEKGLANWHCWVSYSIWILKNDKKMERNVKLFHLICCRNLVEDKIWCNLLKSYAFSKFSFSQIGKLLISLNF